MHEPRESPLADEPVVRDMAQTALVESHLIVHTSVMQTIPCTALILTRSFPMTVAAVYALVAAAASIVAALRFSSVLLAISRTCNLAAAVSAAFALSTAVAPDAVTLLSLCASLLITVMLTAMLARLHDRLHSCTHDDAQRLLAERRSSMSTVVWVAGAVCFPTILLCIDHPLIAL